MRVVCGAMRGLPGCVYGAGGGGVRRFRSLLSCDCTLFDCGVRLL